MRDPAGDTVLVSSQGGSHAREQKRIFRACAGGRDVGARVSQQHWAGRCPYSCRPQAELRGAPAREPRSRMPAHAPTQTRRSLTCRGDFLTDVLFCFVLSFMHASSVLHNLRNDLAVYFTFSISFFTVSFLQLRSKPWGHSSTRERAEVRAKVTDSQSRTVKTGQRRRFTCGACSEPQEVNQEKGLSPGQDTQMPNDGHVGCGGWRRARRRKGWT